MTVPDEMLGILRFEYDQPLIDEHRTTAFEYRANSFNISYLVLPILNRNLSLLKGNLSLQKRPPVSNKVVF